MVGKYYRIRSKSRKNGGKQFLDKVREQLGWFSKHA